MTTFQPTHVESQLIRTQTAASNHREHATSIYMTSSFTFENAEHGRALFTNEVEGYIYSRYTNPNIDEFIKKMCIIEGADSGVALASGMSAIFTALASLLNHGDHVLAARNVFGTTRKILAKIMPRWGISHSYADLTAPDEWEALVQPNTQVVILETPSNPALDIIDLDWIGRFCRAHGLILIVDNVFATSYLQNPIKHGANIVMHSTTKYIDGQGRGMGGVLVGDWQLMDKIRDFARNTGPCMSPFNAWLFSKSLETLPVRMERHSQNALALATWLEEQAGINFVKYPHLPSHPQYEIARRQMRLGGGIVTFEVEGGLEQGQRFLDALQMCSLTANLGDSRTIATHPASTTHSSLTEEQRQAVGITAGLIRISVGLEHINDIQGDIAQALESARRA
jgi:O-succinylhomoserine sulfhydrylase